MELTVIVCNVCEVVGKSTTHYEVRSGRRSGQVDLCEEHAGSVDLEGVLGAGKPRARRRTSRVVTLDEIEGLKDKKK